MNDAALWLTQNASPVKKALSTEPLEGDSAQQVGCYLQGTSVSFTSIELKTSSINICIIDDCKDADVPLIETTLRDELYKIGLPGKLILGKRKGLLEVIFS